MSKEWAAIQSGAVVLSAVLLVACDRDSNLSRMSDYELAERYAFCLDREPTAPGMVQVCENLRRECERRRQTLGTYICRTR